MRAARSALAIRDESGRTGRDARAVESVGCAAAAIGAITPGLRVFLLTRGQFSLLDMVLHVVTTIGPSGVAIWTWALAEFEVEALGGFMVRRDITGARLVVDRSTEQARFGAEAVRVCKNHAKMARVWTADRRVLIRGSMNLNFNPRFEQADLTEGGPEFALVAEVEESLPVLAPLCSNAEADFASGVSRQFEASTLGMFRGLKVWAK